MLGQAQSAGPPEKGKDGCWGEPGAPGAVWVPAAGMSYATSVAPGRSVASVGPGGDPGVTAQRPPHRPLSPQMTWSLALPQKALPFPKSASPCRALLPSKPRKVKALASPRLPGSSCPGCLSSPAVPCSSVWTVSGGRLPPSSQGSIFHSVALCPRCWCVCHPCGQSSFRGLSFGKEEASASDGGPSWGPKCPLPGGPALPVSPPSPAVPVRPPEASLRLPDRQAFSSLWAVRMLRQAQTLPEGGLTACRGAWAADTREKHAQKLQAGR